MDAEPEKEHPLLWKSIKNQIHSFYIAIHSTVKVGHKQNWGRVPPIDEATEIQLLLLSIENGDPSSSPWPFCPYAQDLIPKSEIAG